MPAYVIGQIVVKDADKWSAYRAQVPATLGPWGGQVLFRGRTARVLAGGQPVDRKRPPTPWACVPDRAAGCVPDGSGRKPS